jgi:hypothetical protein
MRAILSFVVVLSLAQSTRLKIVVVEGEDAVNIIQQRTAVAPIVEVRDRNNLPVAGVAVAFAIIGTTASFPGGQALVVTTDVAGRATAGGLTPTANGAFQIDVTATYQGQTATTTITQTNFATVQEAAQAGRTPSQSGSGASAATAGVGATAGAVRATPAGTAAGSAAAGAAGGGMSAATIAIIAGAAAGGAVAAKKALSGSSSSSSSAPSGPTSFIVAGLFSGNLPVTSTGTGPGGVLVCNYNVVVSGSLRMALTQQDASVTGGLTGNGTDTVPPQSSCGLSLPGGGSEAFTLSGPVIGSPSNLRYSQTVNLSGQATMVHSFSGTLNAGVVTGTLTVTFNQQVSINQPPPFPGVIVVNATGSTTIPVTLR